MATVRLLCFAGCAISFVLSAFLLLVEAGCDPGSCGSRYTAEIVTFGIAGVVLGVIAIRLVGWEERRPPDDEQARKPRA